MLPEYFLKFHESYWSPLCLLTDLWDMAAGKIILILTATIKHHSVPIIIVLKQRTKLNITTHIFIMSISMKVLFQLTSEKLCSLRACFLLKPCLDCVNIFLILSLQLMSTLLFLSQSLSRFILNSIFTFFNLEYRIPIMYMYLYAQSSHCRKWHIK